MGRILYIKPKGTEKTYGFPVSILETGPDGPANDSPGKKCTRRLAEVNKYMDCLSVSNWLSDRGKKHRQARRQKKFWL